VIGSIVDTGDLLQVIWASLAAGIGVTGVFGVAILGGSRAVDSARDGDLPAAGVFAALGVVALAAVVASIVFAIVVLTEK
jgi:hypothetical protein